MKPYEKFFTEEVVQSSADLKKGMTIYYFSFYNHSPNNPRVSTIYDNELGKRREKTPEEKIDSYSIIQCEITAIGKKRILVKTTKGNSKRAFNPETVQYNFAPTYQDAEKEIKAMHDNDPYATDKYIIIERDTLFN